MNKRNKKRTLLADVCGEDSVEFSEWRESILLVLFSLIYCERCVVYGVRCVCVCLWFIRTYKYVERRIALFTDTCSYTKRVNICSLTQTVRRLVFQGTYLKHHQQLHRSNRFMHVYNWFCAPACVCVCVRVFHTQKICNIQNLNSVQHKQPNRNEFNDSKLRSFWRFTFRMHFAQK